MSVLLLAPPNSNTDIGAPPLLVLLFPLHKELHVEVAVTH